MSEPQEPTAEQRAANLAEQSTWPSPSFSEGGFIPSAGPVPPMPLHPDECLVTSPDGPNVAICRRAGHPTPTSDCTRIAWIRHESAEDAS